MENTGCLLMCAKIYKSTHILATFTIGMIGKETGHMLKFVKLYAKVINTHET